jgi:HTH-type transcriptional regulator/antitoxin HigA
MKNTTKVNGRNNDAGDLNVHKTAAAWSSLADTVFVPHSEKEYRQLVGLLDRLIDEVGEDESHPLASLMEIVGVLVQHYEDQHVPELIAK